PRGSQEADRNVEERLEGSDRQGEFNGQAIRRSWPSARLDRRTYRAGEDVRTGVDLQRPQQERGRRLRVAVEGLRQEPVAKRDMGSGADLARLLVLSFPRGIAGRARRALLVQC